MTELVSSARCVLGNPERPHLAEAGFVCNTHLGALARTLLEVEELSTALELGKTTRASGDGRGGQLASQRIPLSEAALALVGPVAAGNLTSSDGDDDTPHAPTVLASWTAMVREERDLAPQDSSLTADRRLLSDHLQWIAEQPWVDDFADELRVLLGHLRRALPHLVHRKRTVTCWAILETERGSGPCGGRVSRRTVWRTARTANGPVNIETDDGPWTCDRCRASWDPDDERVQLIVKQLEAEATRPRTDDGRPMLTAAEIADRRGVTPAAVRQRASRLRIGARNLHYDPAALGWADDTRPRATASA